MSSKLYSKTTWVDEVLAGIATYLLKDDAGDTVYEEASIELATGVITPGTAVTAATMQNIEDGIDDIDDLLVSLQSKFALDPATEITVSGGTLTLTQSVHKVQPESGTADDIDNLAGLSAGQFGVLFASDNGTDTLTLKHGTGNISCAGGADIVFSEGALICYSDGTTVYVSGGGRNIGQNFIINGSFNIAQRGTSFTAGTNNNDTYNLDRFIILSDGNDIVDISQSTIAPVGMSNSMKLEVETANKQFGILTILENKDSKGLINKNVSLSFQARMAAADDNTHSLKALILSWSGTADVVTSNVVNAWGADPSLIANWTAENTAVSQTLTTNFQTFKIENIAIDTANAANVAVFIFCDQVDGAIDDAIYISGVKLELGTSATEFIPRPTAQELALCQRYCQNIYIPVFVANGTTTVYGFTSLQNEMFSAPTITQLVALGITDVVSANFSQSAPNITPIYAGTKAIAANYGNFTGLVSGGLYFNQPSASDGPTLLVAEL